MSWYGNLSETSSRILSDALTEGNSIENPASPRDYLLKVSDRIAWRFRTRSEDQDSAALGKYRFRGPQP